MRKLAPAVKSALLAIAGCTILTGVAVAAAPCPVDHDQLVKALKASVKPSGGPGNGGVDNNQRGAAVGPGGGGFAKALYGGKTQDQRPRRPALSRGKGKKAEPP